MKATNQLSDSQKESLLKTLKSRFEKNKARHEDLNWEQIVSKLESSASEGKLWSIYQLEETGGEPDVVGFDPSTSEFIFYDCSPETPKGRRSICYDREGLESRKDYPPKDTAMDMATDMGVELLNEEEYRSLQALGKFDQKTSSWLKTPDEVRKLGGAIFGDFRYGRVFIYHNGAQSYYGGRGFRASIRV
ncbi:DUF4256 domain-containing protein [Algoriphagus marinus]|uniref:DUF4256 domain-containing protein n=1 Tax=Algoriphagus marinus TaxID=1925762 RepID=UPI00094BB823|nr:DUF4256 domain-containing protein [Algoriphagus marinus]